MRARVLALALIVAILPMQASPARADSAHAAPAAASAAGASLLPVRARAEGLRAAAGAVDLSRIVSTLAHHPDPSTELPAADASIAALLAVIRDANAQVRDAAIAIRAAGGDARKLQTLAVRLSFEAGRLTAPLGRSTGSLAADRARRDAVALRLAALRASLEAAAGPAWARTAILDAGTRVAAALDRALPSLLAPAASAPPAADPAECDVIDQSPVLCVSGTGANHHTTPSLLVIDQGGDDTYDGPFAAMDSSASVVVDLAGNDVYTAGPDGGVAGLGSFGVGILVDAGGDDSYTGANGEGGGLAGVGVLADLGGDDHYALGGASALTGQAGSVAGVAALVDGGQGADDYRMRVTTPTGCEGQLESAFGQASTAIGGALLADDGGADGFSMTGVAANGCASLTGQVMYQEGEAYLLEGVGDTRYEQIATAGDAAISNLGQVQGFDGEGVLWDRGGDDVYDARVAIGRSVRVRATDRCKCAAVATNHAQGLLTSLQAQSVAFSFARQGTSLLQDDAGDDRYTARVTAAFSATVADARRRGGSASADAVGQVLVLNGQATTGTVPDRVLAVLLDRAGDDRYSLVTISTASARANGRAGERRTASATALSAGGAGQASGFAARLIDAGGANDFEAIARSGATAWPTPWLARDGIDAWYAVQGTQGGVFVDGGAGSTFAVEPNLGSTVGNFGEAADGATQGWWDAPFFETAQWLEWTEQPAAARPLYANDLYVGSDGFSAAPHTKTVPRIAFVAPVPSALGSAPARIAAQLVHVNGAPLEGRWITFELVRPVACGPPPDTCLIRNPDGPRQYEPVDVFHGVTDARGRASVTIAGSGIEPGYYVLVVFFSGDRDRRFAAATTPIRVG